MSFMSVFVALLLICTIGGGVQIKRKMNSSKATPDLKMPFDGLQMVRWALQIAAGMAHIHSRGFIHFNLKPQNVVLNDVNELLICLSSTVKRVAPDAPVVDTHLMSEFKVAELDMEAPPLMTVGTPLYMAPEMQLVRLNKECTNAVDAWAYGVLLVRLFTQSHPYPSSTTVNDLRLYVATNELRPIDVARKDLPHPGLKEVIDGCLKYRAAERFTFAQIEARLSKILEEMLEIKMKVKAFPKPLRQSCIAKVGKSIWKSYSWAQRWEVIRSSSSHHELEKKRQENGDQSK